MQYASLQLDESSVRAAQSGQQSPKRDWKAIAIGVGLGVVILNATLTAVLVCQMMAAQAKVEKYDAAFNQLQALVITAKPQVKYYIGEFDHFATQARHISDVASRVLHGNIADLINDVAQSDWSLLGQNVTTFAASIRKAFDYTTTGSYEEEINRIAAIVESVSAIVRKVDPKWTYPAPQPDDDAGILNMFSYLVDWANQQATTSKWSHAAQSCVDLIDTVIPIDWSGKYVWHNGKYYGTYDWNEWVNSNLPQVAETCALFANAKVSNETSP